jgi:hypothetical protein
VRRLSMARVKDLARQAVACHTAAEVRSLPF